VILVIDASDFSRSQTAEILRAQGYDIIQGASGIDAVQAMRRGHLDAVLLDNDLPDMGALEVVGEAARAGALVPVLLCKSSWQIPEVVAAIRAGAWDVIKKPFSARELSDKLSEAVAGADERRLRRRQANKLALIGRLAVAAVHDMSNQVTTMHGFGEILATVLAPNDAPRSFLDQINGAAQRCAMLTGRLLAFAQGHPLPLTAINLNHVVGRVVDLMRLLYRGRLEIVTYQPPDLGFIEGDAAEMEQLLFNLLANAQDAMPRHGQVVICTTNHNQSEAADRLPPGEYVLLTIVDNGSGMSEEALARLFEPYFSTRPMPRAAGMGLTVAADILDRAGAVAKVSSTERGTCLSIYFPRMPAPDTLCGTDTIVQKRVEK
jgi:signal transduction histidine kinase